MVNYCSLHNVVVAVVAVAVVVNSAAGVMSHMTCYFCFINKAILKSFTLLMLYMQLGSLVTNWIYLGS